MQIDINAILNAALSAAVAEAIKPLAEQIESLKTELAAVKAAPAPEAAVLDLSSTDFVGAVEAIALRCAEGTMEDHTAEHDHDELGKDISDEVADALRGLDLSDYFDIEDAVRSAVQDLTFEVRVS